MVALTTLPKTAPVEEIIEVIKRDGGIIIKDFVSPSIIDDFHAALAPGFKDAEKKQANQAAFSEPGVEFFASNTVHAFGLLARAPNATVSVLQDELFVKLNDTFLNNVRTHMIGDTKVEAHTSWQLNVTTGMKVTSGAGHQILHRDQTIHSVDAKEGDLYTSMTGCLIAGTDSSARNGATRVCPGSHLWSPERAPKDEDAASAEMTKGSALFWLGSTYHGAGANTTKPGDADDTRILFGVFACADYLRQEENQILAVPMSVARTLPKDIQQRIGWWKSVAGAGFYELGHPAETYAPFKDTSVSVVA